MQVDLIQNPDDYVEQFRKRHLPSAVAPAGTVIKQQDSVVSMLSGFLKRTIRKLTSGHTECNYEIQEAETYEANLKNVLNGLVADRQQLVAKANQTILPDGQRCIVKTYQELLEELGAQNMQLRRALKDKFDSLLEKNAPEIVQGTGATFDDIMPDRKAEEIKLLKQSLLNAQQRLKKYYMRVSPQQLAQLNRQNMLLKQQVLKLAAERQNDPSMHVGQYPARMYPQLKEKNRMLTELIQRKTPYLFELRQRSTALDSSQMVYDIQNRHIQYEMARMEKHHSPVNFEYKRDQLQTRYNQLRSEYLRLEELIKTGARIQEEAAHYNLAIIGRPFA